jgi:hypothetical protein
MWSYSPMEAGSSEGMSIWLSPLVAHRERARGALRAL